MKKLILLFTLLLLPSLSVADDFDRFLGKWSAEGEIFLTITLKNDVVKMKFPENDTWRAEFQNIRIEEGVLKFEQINYMKDNSFKEKHGMEHPYSGVVNYSEMWIDDEGNMLYKVWTDYMADVEPIIVNKINE